jgi:nicotinamidase/pyrazinamidase
MSEKHALLVVDIQQDFYPGGSMAVEESDRVIEPTNQLIDWFDSQEWPIYFTRDWHPENHCSFDPDGPWPPHCIAGTPGAQFHPDLHVPGRAHIISKATDPEQDAYSGFDGTNLLQQLKEQEVDSVVVAGLTTDYCVKMTALDAHRLGFNVQVAIDAVRAVNAKIGDGRRAIIHMQLRRIHFDDAEVIVKKLSH